MSGVILRAGPRGLLAWLTSSADSQYALLFWKGCFAGLTVKNKGLERLPGLVLRSFSRSTPTGHAVNAVVCSQVLALPLAYRCENWHLNQPVRQTVRGKMAHFCNQLISMVGLGGLEPPTRPL